MKRALLIIAAVGLMLPAGAAAATKSKVIVDGYTFKGGGSFHGRVKSPKKRCGDDRKVRLFHKDPGADTKIGSDRTEPSKLDNTYFWFIDDPKPEGGKYYAKIRARDGCDGDTSKVFLLVF